LRFSATSSRRPATRQTTDLSQSQVRGQNFLPREVKHWSLTKLRERLIKIGAKVVSRSKAVTFQMAEVAVPRRLFASILDRIGCPLLVPGTG